VQGGHSDDSTNISTPLIISLEPVIQGTTNVESGFGKLVLQRPLSAGNLHLEHRIKTSARQISRPAIPRTCSASLLVKAMDHDNYPS